MEHKKKTKNAPNPPAVNRKYQKIAGGASWNPKKKQKTQKKQKKTNLNTLNVASTVADYYYYYK